MKRIAIMATAALVAMGPLAATGASAQQYRDRGDRHDNDRGRDYDRRDNDRRDWDRRNDNRRDWRNDRHERRQQWRRGDRLPSYYRSHYRQVDWRRERLRQPPRGYHYVRDNDRGETLLVGIATGVILGVILGAN